MTSLGKSTALHHQKVKTLKKWNLLFFGVKVPLGELIKNPEYFFARTNILGFTGV